MFDNDKDKVIEEQKRHIKKEQREKRELQKKLREAEGRLNDPRFIEAQAGDLGVGDNDTSLGPMPIANAHAQRFLESMPELRSNPAAEAESRKRGPINGWPSAPSAWVSLDAEGRAWHRVLGIRVFYTANHALVTRAGTPFGPHGELKREEVRAARALEAEDRASGRG